MKNVVKVLIVGCGDLGSIVAKKLTKLGVHTVGVRRSEAKLDGITIIQADVTQLASIEPLKKIQPEILIYCVAANGQTDAQYKAQYVDGLRNILATQLENSKLKHVFFVSSTRVYGQKTDVFIDENTTAIAADFGGERLLEAECLLKALACSNTVLRLSGIYGTGRLRMLNLAASLKTSPENWPQQNSWTNRIYSDDAASFIVFLVIKVLEASQMLAMPIMQSCYIVTDSSPATQYEVLSWIAGQLNIAVPTYVNFPVESGKRLSNKTMLATGFKLRYPDFQTGYQALLSEYNQFKQLASDI